jgi:hypothetical protein
MRTEMAQSRSRIGHAEPVQQGEHSTIESGERFRSACQPNLAGIFSQRHIAPIMQAVLNGTITNDKFCMSRVRQRQLRPACAVRRDEVAYPSEGNEMELIPQEDLYETTTMDYSAFHHSRDRCPASLGSGLPITRPMEQDLPKRPIPKPCHGGMQK